MNNLNYRNRRISKPILYTTSLYHNLYRKTSAVMFKKNAVNNIQQLRDKTACFPIFDGFGKMKNYFNL